MWQPWKPHGDEEAGLKLGRLRPGQGRTPRRLVPWWVRAMRRVKAAGVARRQPKTSRGGGGLRRRAAPSRMYGRRSVVKVSFRRNRGQRRLGKARALSGARASAARARPRSRLRCRARKPRYHGYRAGVGARRPIDVVIHCLAGGRGPDRSAVSMYASWWPGWSATLVRGLSGSRSIITTLMTSTSIC